MSSTGISLPPCGGVPKQDGPSLQGLDVGRVVQVPQVHEAAASSEPLGAAHNEMIPVQKNSSHRYALLDCWRGIACLMVVVAHAREPAAHKYLEGRLPITDWAGQCVVSFIAFGAGVHIFFVISGYCISATVDGFTKRKNSLSLYCSRRFWRIYPPYWSLFVLMTIAATASEIASSNGWIPGSLHSSQSPFKLTPSQFVGNVTLTETWRHHLFGSETKLFLKHAWTLCYEEQFYLIVGVTLLLFPKRFFQSIIGVTMISIGLQVAGAYNLVDVKGFGFDSLWLPFAIGVLVFYRLSHASEHEKRFIDNSILIMAFLTMIPNILFSYWGDPAGSLINTMAISTTFAAILISMHRFDSFLLAKPTFQSLSFVGRISYSLYLVHAPIVPVVARLLMHAGVKSDLLTLLVTIPVCMGISLPLAWGFYLLFERPFLYRKPTVAAADFIPDGNLRTK